jgi:predicted RNA binding protein YcfA (HicA-like mRNA interferase family)
MCKVPSISGKNAVAAFEKAGFEVARVKGSHHIMKREGHPNLLSVPVHNRDIAKGTLRSLITAAGLTVKEFCDLL